MNYKQMIIDSEFSSHEIADAHRACGSQNPPDWKGIWEWLNDHTPTVGDRLEFWQNTRDAAIQRRRTGKPDHDLTVYGLDAWEEFAAGIVD